MSKPDEAPTLLNFKYEIQLISGLQHKYIKMEVIANNAPQAMNEALAMLAVPTQWDLIGYQNMGVHNA